MNRKTVKSYEKENLDTDRKIISADFTPTERRKLFDPTELNENFWHGLNNDSLEHDEENIIKK